MWAAGGGGVEAASSARLKAVEQHVAYDVFNAKLLQPLREAPEPFPPQPQVHVVHPLGFAPLARLLASHALP